LRGNFDCFCDRSFRKTHVVETAVRFGGILRVAVIEGFAQGGNIANSPIMTVFKAIKEGTRDIQEATVYWAAFADKIGAWNDTGGALGHVFSKEKATEYARRIAVITEAEVGQLAEIANAYDGVEKAKSGKGKKGDGTGEKGKAKTAPVNNTVSDTYQLILQDQQKMYQEASDIYQLFLQEETNAAQEASDRYQLLLQDDAKTAQEASDTYQLVVQNQTKTAALSRLTVQNKLAEVDAQERFYKLTAGAAAEKRISLLRQTLALETEAFRAAEGDALLQEQLYTKIQDTNTALLEQQQIMNDSTALGGMTSALNDYAKAAADIGSQLHAFTMNTFSSMEDALVDFVDKGKIDFHSLADSIIKDMARIAIQQSITGPLASGLSSYINLGVGMVQTGLSADQISMVNSPPQYAQGTNYVPDTGMALLHKGEAVIPAAMNKPSSGSGVTINVPVNMDGNNRLASQLRTEIEATVERVLRRVS